MIPRQTLVLLGAAAVLGATPSPAVAWRAVLTPSAVDPTAPLLAAVGLTVWVLAAWVVVATLLVLAARLPGALGRAADAVATRTVPAVLRRTVSVAVGATLALGTTGTLPAGAEQGAPSVAAPVSLDWPITAPADAAPTDERPTGAPPTDLAVGAPTVTSAVTSVVVRPGDSLWALAARDLVARGGNEPSAAAVAHAWPSWWAANREVVGDDPDLLLPGARLLAPDAS